ncbi:MAG: hypothetical protein EBS65_13955 [Betaproteobacteria bacterium]|nr:hypothetical protein [Betaproteobacteria bacterium]
MNVDAPFRVPVRVYYQDTDAGGVVFHAQYLAFMERARTEWLNARGFDLARFADESRILFMVHAISVRGAHARIVEGPAAAGRMNTPITTMKPTL